MTAPALAAEALAPGLLLTESTYEALYEGHAQALPLEVSIGGGDYDVMGRIMLSVLVQEGMKPLHDVVDFGCGTGRLALHAVPYLRDGGYTGIDIAPTMLRHAESQVQAAAPDASSRVRWVHHAGEGFPLEDESADVMAAFSVFTHMEHEDTSRYLVDAARVVRPGGMFVCSFLTMDLPAARDVFGSSAALSLTERWRSVRNVTTTYDYIDALATMAGWRVERWHAGNQETIELLDAPGAMCALGQSIAVLRVS